MPDVNLLVAMSWPEHSHHQLATEWRERNPTFYTCALTELGVLRVLISIGAPVPMAEDQLATVIKHRKALLPCDLSADVLRGKIRGHKQVTDSYLLEVARKNGVKLATLDGGIKGAELVR